MRITRRLVVSLVVVVAGVASLGAYLQVRLESRRQSQDLERRAFMLAGSLEGAIEHLLERKDTGELDHVIETIGGAGGLAGAAVYDSRGELLASTPRLSSDLSVIPAHAGEALRTGTDSGGVELVGDTVWYVHARPLGVRGKPAGVLAVFHDPTPTQAGDRRLWRDAFLRAFALTALLVIATLLVLRWSIAGPIAQMAQWMRQLRTGEGAGPPALPKVRLFDPLAREVEKFSRHLSHAKAAAEEEARLRQAADSLWTPERLSEHVRQKLQGKPLIVVSNREPYMHVRRGRAVECIVPAGGLVTALDPIMRACAGTWLAHGAGDADWDVVDGANRVKVPPDDPLYSLRRVPLTKDEENGYYYGFANQKFADAATDEMKGLAEPCVLIQDYHLALLPALLKERRPDARVAIFWHIPWPNPEAFGICPWRRELLLGILGADLIGFHTQFHCNNFLDTVDRTLESRVDWERFEVRRGGHATIVHPFPISVAFPNAFQDVPPAERPQPDRDTFFKESGIDARIVGIGVDRMDYTKGILERFRAIERYLDKHPGHRGELTFVQIAAPSRTHIKRYHDFLAEVEAEAERINWRFKAGEWKPIVFLKRHHSHREILPFYRHADFCMVTSLHDGMNLVAKEFVASRDDNGGVLILSRFTGASRELRDALIVNPYDIEEMAEAIHAALRMDRDERASRMTKMREMVREHNVYRWAGTMIEALSQVRLDQATAANE